MNKLHGAHPDDVYLWNNGDAQRAYLSLGCHFIEQEKAHRFCVWAPNALKVSVVGDFNDWDKSSDIMHKNTGGVFSCMINNLKDGDLYKYLITSEHGDELYKADPFAFYSQLRPDTASKVWSLEGYSWNDEKYMKERIKKSATNKPISIYELHLGSWKKDSDDNFLSYRQIADELVVYVKKMGFTHIELLPISEHPFDGSWGYQVTGYYSITSRHGSPQDFMYFMDTMHQNNIGVILDWVPAHFPRDTHGLREFDGTPIFEHPDPLQSEQPQWGTLLFDCSRLEVVSFLVSNAMFFADIYHIDGLRLDAVSAMLYLNFGKDDGQYIKNPEGGDINYDAVDLLKKLNTTILTNYPGFMMIAEESTAYPLVTTPPYDGGLGFSYKWDMGFMNDMLDYMSADHLYRKDMHHNVTFSMHYAFSENYILAFSHDEVVHGKHAMIDKMFGEYSEKFSSLRAFYGYIFSHPGKKLLFMGNEFGQFIEWNYEKELEWFLLEYDSHKKLQKYIQKLNRFYKKNRALFDIDNSWDGYEWLNADDNANSIIAYMRTSKIVRGKQQQLICVTNFTPIQRDNYVVALPQKGTLTEVFNTDSTLFGGSGVTNDTMIKSRKKACNNKKFSAQITVPPLTTLYFEYVVE